MSGSFVEISSKSFFKRSVSNENVGSIFLIFSFSNMKNENIFSGIYIKNIDVSNLSKDDATKKLNEYIQNYLPEEIILKHGDYETSINLSDLNIKFNINEAVDLSYNIGRNKNFIKNNFENEPDVCLPMASEEDKDVRRSFWTMRANGILAKGVRDNPYVFFEQFCNAFKQNKIDRCGFLYELNGKDETFEEQFLSDGENGFMSRYALLYLISKTTNEKFLILLDEPETHFNEHWKRYFLKLLCDVLAQKDTDVFVATHSAMLVSDVKKHELHRFELNDNEIISNDCLLNSYGANIIDIGQILFKMEGNIGERAKDEIEKLLNSNSKKDIEKIERLLSEVGPGEYRWRLRAKLQELMSQKKVTVPVCPLVRKRRKYA